MTVNVRLIVFILKVAPIGIVVLYVPCAVAKLDIRGLPKGTRKSLIRSVYDFPYAISQLVHSPLIILMQSSNFFAENR